MTSTLNQRFLPWLSNLIMAFYGAIASYLCVYFLFRRGHTGLFFICLGICVFFTVYQWKQFSKRAYGQWIEKRAIASLRVALKKRDGVSITSSVMLKSGGDADAVVAFGLERFNIEIKAVENAKKITSKHLEQTARAAKELRTIPVIWLARSKTNDAVLKDGVWIISGGAKSLIKYMESIK